MQVPVPSYAFGALHIHQQLTQLPYGPKKNCFLCYFLQLHDGDAHQIQGTAGMTTR